MSSASDFIVENGVLTKYVGPGGDVVIPDGVMSIGDSAFSWCSRLTSVTIPDGVTSIGDRAFCGCKSLASVTIPDGVTSIGDDAFWGCDSLTSVTIPAGVTCIGGWAFWDCSSLTSVTIPDSVTSIGASAFKGCSGLRSVTIPDSVTYIGYEAFSKCAIQVVSSHRPLTSEALDKCSCGLFLPGEKNRYRAYSAKAYSDNLSEFVAKANWMAYDLELINNGPKFKYSLPARLLGALGRLLEPIELSEENRAFYIELLNNNAKKLVQLAEMFGSRAMILDFFSLGVLDEKAIKGLKKALAASVVPEIAALSAAETIAAAKKKPEEKQTSPLSKEYSRDFVIENDVIKKYKGSGGDVIIPEGVTWIAENAFRDCPGLVSLTIPEGVTAIGKTAFKECTGLRRISLPNGLQSLGNRCFEGCASLDNVVIPNSVTSMGTHVFADCGSLSNVTLPEGLGKIGQRMFSRCKSLRRIRIPESVTCIDTCAFWGCNVLSDVILPEKLQSIGTEAFCFCQQLLHIELPERGPSIENRAFQYSGLTAIEIPENVGWIGDEAFQSTGKIEITILGTPYLGKDFTNDAFYAPHMPLNKITAPAMKRLAVLGWILSTERDPAADETAAKSFQKYWETHLDAYLDELKKDGRILHALVEKRLLTLDQTDKLLELYSEDVETTALLLDYKSKRFNEETIEANEEKKIEKELRGPSKAAELKKNWTSKTLPDGSVQLNSYKGEDLKVIVPEQIGKKPVTRIGDYCFDPRADLATNNMKVPNEETRYRMTDVTIPGQIQEIGVCAFDGCEGMEMISLNEGLLMIGENAFHECRSLKSVVIPRSVKCIFYGAFSGCKSLKDIYITSAETKIGMTKEETLGRCYINRWRDPRQKPKSVFNGCRKLTIHAPAGSYAEQYAKENNIPFVAE